MGNTGRMIDINLYLIRYFNKLIIQDNKNTWNNSELRVVEF